MSRIAKYPVPVPKGVEVSLAGGSISVKGPLGAIARPANPNVGLQREGEAILQNAPYVDLVVGTANVDRVPELVDEVRRTGSRLVALEMPKRGSISWQKRRVGP